MLGPGHMLAPAVCSCSSERISPAHRRPGAIGAQLPLKTEEAMSPDAPGQLPGQAGSQHLTSTGRKENHVSLFDLQLKKYGLKPDLDPNLAPHSNKSLSHQGSLPPGLITVLDLGVALPFVLSCKPASTQQAVHLLCSNLASTLEGHSIPFPTPLPPPPPAATASSASCL